VHPHLGTVTYLSTSTGGPTVILDKKGTFAYGSDASSSLKACVLSYPSIGKHICFDGELLHGAPSSLAYPEMLDSVEDFRVTFLVNVWLDHMPIQSQRLEEGVAKSLRITPDLVNSKPLCMTERQVVKPLKTKESHNINHKWAIGGTEYIIDINLPPLRSFREAADPNVVDLVKLERSSMYPGEISDSSSGSDSSGDDDEKDDEEEEEEEEEEPVGRDTKKRNADSRGGQESSNKGEKKKPRA
jgi:hypothetical protein